MAALKQDSSESESEDGATTYRSLAGIRDHTISTLTHLHFDFRVSYSFHVQYTNRSMIIRYFSTLTGYCHIGLFTAQHK